jgi:hypothetical protein
MRAYLAPLFPEVPRPNFGGAMQDLRKLFAKRYPKAEKLQETDLADASLIDEVERGGLIRQPYAAGRR